MTARRAVCFFYGSPMGEPFWKTGLHFNCTQCSSCCRLEPGYVFLSRNDIVRLVGYLESDVQTFIRSFARLVDVGDGYVISLGERDNFDCIFWGSGGCTVYEARPVQCSTYPFWSGILDSREDWNRESADCPGIDKGPLVEAVDISDKLVQRRKNPPVHIPYGTSLESIDENTVLGGQGFVTDSTDSRETEE